MQSYTTDQPAQSLYEWPIRPGWGALSGLVLVPAKPSCVFHASAVVTFFGPPPRSALAWRQAVFAAALASQTLVSWSQMRFMMISGLRASSWPLLTSGSMAWKVNSVSGRPSRPL